MSLAGKNAIITGGSRGIGKAIAIELARNGVNVAITFANNKDMAEKVVDEIKEYKVKAIAIQADVSKEEDVLNMVKSVKENIGDVDILVNNAGINRDNLLMRMDTEDWDKVIDTNLRGTYLCTKSVIRDMIKKKGGKIINITSVAGVAGNFGQTNYSASKAGVIGFTKSLAKEVASRGINVNAVAPGLIETDMTSVLKEDIKNSLVKNIPMGRLGTVQDIANIVVFLASERSDYITGQVINVDGGMIM